MIITESNLLNKGIIEYIEKNNDELAILESINAFLYKETQVLMDF